MFADIKKKLGVAGIVNIIDLGEDVKKNMASLLEVIDASYAISNGIIDFEDENASRKERNNEEWIEKAKSCSGELAKIRKDFEELKRAVGNYIDDIAEYEGYSPIVQNAIQKSDFSFVKFIIADASTRDSHDSLVFGFVEALENRAEKTMIETNSLKNKWKNANYDVYNVSVKNLLSRSVDVVKRLYGKEILNSEPCEE